MFNYYHSVDKACKKFLFTLIPEAYVRSFKNKYTVYANVNVLTYFHTYGLRTEYYKTVKYKKTM